jgi:HSP20 family protein
MSDLNQDTTQNPFMTKPEMDDSSNKPVIPTTSSTVETSNEWKPEDVPQLTVDVYKKGEVIYIVSTVAGVKAEDLDISIDGGVLTIRGQRRRPYQESESDVLVEECFWGEFFRELEIKENLNVDKVKADLRNGILTIEIPIIKVVTQKKISVNMG